MLTQRDKLILRFVERFGGITISQCADIFFRDAKHGYDLSRKRIKKICEMTDLRYFTNRMTGERVYCNDKKITPHNVILLDVYAKFIKSGCTILEFIKEPRYLDGKRRADGFFKIEFNGEKRIIIVEVEVMNSTDFTKYEEMWDAEVFKEEYGDNFPLVLNVGDLSNTYSNPNFDVVCLDYSLNGFVERVLA